MAGDEASEALAPDEALENAWNALDHSPLDKGAKRAVVRLLREHPGLARPQRQGAIEALLRDPDVDPQHVSAAGWSLLQADGRLAPDGDPRAIATALERDGVAQSLLEEACVSRLDAERTLTGLRRWLLLSGEWRQHPRLARALETQARLNGGAWPFEEDEREKLEQTSPAFASAYRPLRASEAATPRFGDPVTQSVADQYARWPYPTWSRLSAPEETTLPRAIEKLDGGQECGLPVAAEVLVAGCGTGREAAQLARRFPDAHVTAIDISAASLDYAAERCAGLGIDFRLLDLHDARQLGREFDLVACSGVLHHLSDPEAGWARLADVLAPGGVMKIMLYSRVGRLGIEAAKRRIADLRELPVDDDLLRAVRRRLIAEAPDFVAGFYDFYSLAGVHDLLLNRHEDPFDVPRIGRALDRLGLELLAFKLPTAADKAQYLQDHPGDPLLRDRDAWAQIEATRPFIFSAMYEFWCRKPA